MDIMKIIGVWGLVYMIGLGVAEVLWHRKKGLPYNWRESSVSMADMIIRNGLTFMLGGGLLTWIAPWISTYAIFDLPIKIAGVVQWGRLAGLFVGLEFLYYWMHRWDHEIRWFWATHSVHHTPNSMNLFTAERLGWTQIISAAVLTMTPLLVIGFHVQDVLTMFAINLMYQYWLHTEMIGKLGWFEGVFNTPSHHRVHHGSNPNYLDSNYGGVVIIFDRMFGTFVEETEKVVFGLVSPVVSMNPIYVALHEWINIGRDIRDNWRHPSRLGGYLFGPPGWSHDGSRGTSEQIQKASLLTASP